IAAYKMVDTCAAEFEAATPYYYSCYESANEVDPKSDKQKVLVLGSGPIRIGQGIEFDYCSVHCVWALKECGYETIIVNNNPETVSTDFDVADKLYFEPLTPEDVRNIVELEKPIGAVVQFGGQTAINLSQALGAMGVPILGTSAEDVDAAEDREKFDALLEECGIPRPKGATVFKTSEAIDAANELGYPVLLRPSYVLGGAGMQIAFSDNDVVQFMSIINRTVQEHPILVDKYLMGKEVEVDAVCDGEDILIPGIMEHLERAGVHSGDSISVYPPQSVSQKHQDTLVEYTRRLAKGLHVKGLVNIQFIIYQDDIYVIEVNPRSSRTVPYISKITGVPIVSLATAAIFGKTIPEQGFSYGLVPAKNHVAIKLPVFSFEKLAGAEISLGPEMKSTGEVLGLAASFPEALIKAFVGGGYDLPRTYKVVMTVKDADKEELIPIAKRFVAMGYDIYSTSGTYRALVDHGVKVTRLSKLDEGHPNCQDMLLNGEVDLIINTPTNLREHNRDGFVIRRTAVETGTPCITSLDTASALLTSLEYDGKDSLSVIDIARI
ncbi:MAG: carbamoyl-phosphate synthase large subunit, partial [Clostridiales bacterium]|nr:carbamoyl-phosphate synthase large subunit [Clostridiales bacterium]